MALLEEIVDASNKKNGGREASEKYILKSMGEHATEIKELFEKKDAHWKNECADMMIHCLCLFKHSGISEMEVLGVMEERKKKFMENINGK